MGIFDLFHKLIHKENIKNNKIIPQVKVDPLNLTKSQLEQVIDYMKEKYSKPVIRIHTQKSEHLGIFDSKFGGYPYMPKNGKCICNLEGKPLILLAQLNCSKEHFNAPLPQKGILQFFIDCDHQNGLDLDHPGIQNGYRVVYYEDIDESVTEDDVIKIGMRSNRILNQKQEYFPFYDEYQLSFEVSKECIPECDNEEFNFALEDALASLFDIKIEEAVYKYFHDDDYEYINQSLSNWGHKLLGYPCFTQWDPRGDDYNERYNTLLFQMDSEIPDLLWGDSGVANFFINLEKLKNLDFSDVLYNWDCC